MNQSPLGHKVPLVIGLIVIILVGALTLTLLHPNKGSGPRSSETGITATGTSQTTSSPFIQSNASTTLRLTTSISSSNLRVGQNLSLSMSVTNILPTAATVLPSTDWSFEGVPVTPWGACHLNYPLEVEIVRGNYSVQQLPNAVNATFGYTCYSALTANTITFQADSDLANVTWTGPGPGVVQTFGPYVMSYNFTTSGFWNLADITGSEIPVIGGGNGAPPPPTPFTPGTYTVAVEDEWGQVSIMHFTVVNG